MTTDTLRVVVYVNQFFGGIGGMMLDIGIICYAVLTLFHLVTLPVEFDASRRAKLTFVVVGGGPTGVELAGALREIAVNDIQKDFRNIDTSTARVLSTTVSPPSVARTRFSVGSWHSSPRARAMTFCIRVLIARPDVARAA